MNYHKHYNLLIERSQGRTVEGYTERHHILPKCLGGNDSSTNIAVLTPEEHFVAHLLLMKMYPTEHRLAFAVKMMTSNNRFSKRKNKLYGWVKRKINSAHKKPRKPRAKETKPRKKRQLSIEHRARIGASRRGKALGPRSEEIKRKISNTKKMKKH